MDKLNKLEQELKENILLEWEKLLQQGLTERYYQSFLAENAGIFLGNLDCHLIISKLKLGSELETDFVTLTDGFSNGNQFELIEIKQPSTKLFTKSGVISSDLNKATQQIRDWKRWLIDNKSWLRKYLPTISTRVVTESQIKFKIIIGRRLENSYEIEKRNQIAKEVGAEIRSFDYLTDRFRARIPYLAMWLLNKSRTEQQEVENPFYEAITDSEWKRICNNKKLSTSHFYKYHFEDVLESRGIN